MPLHELPDMPEHTVGFRATGLVSAEDYRAVFDPALDRAIATGTPVNVVYILGREFDRYSVGALWEDLRLEAQPHDSWGRLALVTDHALIAEVIHLLSFVLPGHVRIFPTDAEREAVDWASASPE
ncbi:STAS/SEC14 domain-containing protein [Demequina mangrovi]|uniref:SpoIIAA-like n=1 Tax=Demequina mangrovi TaxID=1043493 RepID=A0A1H6V4U0_9MICO|nr:STAS/SEC14 domain-containing protein [Demequina mangrovi]SEI97954.1 SpoIIAA-like [Demequina mangrovi]